MEPCVHGARGHRADHVVRLHARHAQLRQAQHLPCAQSWNSYTARW